ncbi:phosphoglycerate mutase-like protein 4 isoform X1 [Arachis duranensis]|uniref:Phosphoglycerate mutase-like protein 4 isoform X1 n=1 Tax=Arachis duranensis TaxID=130453 RepID=A0A6P4CKY9_ARADU|nr:phosphoglycerate mutase-like protein 4 isoform X1 [Arachis duranensis]
MNTWLCVNESISVSIPKHKYSRSHSYSFPPNPLPLPSFLRLKSVSSLPKQQALNVSLTRHSTHSLQMADSSISDSDSSHPHPEYAEIVVVRHGETAWNADGRIQGHLDVELNEAGRQQAAAVADRLSREPKISFIYSSDLQRAYETAQIIASRCGGLEVIKDSDLRERHLGDLQGLIYREAAKTHPIAHKAFSSRNEDQEIPGGGESIAQLFQRCTSALQRIGRKHKGERVVVVTHGGFIRSLYRWACPNGRPAGKIHNTSVNVFHMYGEDKWTLKLWGDVSHLSQDEFLASGFGGDRTSG